MTIRETLARGSIALPSLLFGACGGQVDGKDVGALRASSPDAGPVADGGDIGDVADAETSITPPDDLPDQPDDLFEGLWAVTYNAGEPPDSFGWMRLGADGAAFFQRAPDAYPVWSCDGRGTWTHKGASAIDLDLPSACFHGSPRTTFTVKQASAPPPLRAGSYASAYLGAPELAQWMWAYKYPSSLCYPTIASCPLP